MYIYIYIHMAACSLAAARSAFFSFSQVYRKMGNRDADEFVTSLFVPVKENDPKTAWDHNPKPFFKGHWAYNLKPCWG